MNCDRKCIIVLTTSRNCLRSYQRSIQFDIAKAKLFVQPFFLYSHLWSSRIYVIFLPSCGDVIKRQKRIKREIFLLLEQKYKPFCNTLFETSNTPVSPVEDFKNKQLFLVFWDSLTITILLLMMTNTIM